MTSSEDINNFVMGNPKYKGILERAIKFEEENAEKEHYMGWQWNDVRAYPAELMKLIREGVVDIRYKSRKYTHYILSDREATKKAL